jgi:hypothetical protein
VYFTPPRILSRNICYSRIYYPAACTASTGLTPRCILRYRVYCAQHMLYRSTLLPYTAPHIVSRSVYRLSRGYYPTAYTMQSHVLCPTRIIPQRITVAIYTVRIYYSARMFYPALGAPPQDRRCRRELPLRPRTAYTTARAYTTPRAIPEYIIRPARSAGTYCPAREHRAPRYTTSSRYESSVHYRPRILSRRIYYSGVYYSAREGELPDIRFYLGELRISNLRPTSIPPPNLSPTPV